MGSDLSKHQAKSSLKQLLKAAGTGIKDETAKTYINAVGDINPWLLTGGSFSRENWEKHRVEIARYMRENGEDSVPPNILSLWALVKDCLSSPKVVIQEHIQDCINTLGEIQERESQTRDDCAESSLESMQEKEGVDKKYKTRK